jgi:hypothetical protein
LGVLALAGCGGMTHRDTATVVGAGVGAAAGAAITGVSAVQSPGVSSAV